MTKEAKRTSVHCRPNGVRGTHRPHRQPRTARDRGVEMENEGNQLRMTHSWTPQPPFRRPVTERPAHVERQRGSEATRWTSGQQTTTPEPRASHRRAGTTTESRHPRGVMIRPPPNQLGHHQPDRGMVAHPEKAAQDPRREGGEVDRTKPSPQAPRAPPAPSATHRRREATPKKEENW